MFMKKKVSVLSLVAYLSVLPPVDKEVWSFRILEMCLSA